MGKVNILKCRLKRPVVTANFELIPAGTPVQVLKWADNSKAVHLPDEELKVKVIVEAYMYLDDDTPNRRFVDSGLIIETQVNNLYFMDYEVRESSW